MFQNQKQKISLMSEFWQFFVSFFIGLKNEELYLNLSFMCHVLFWGFFPILNKNKIMQFVCSHETQTRKPNLKVVWFCYLQILIFHFSFGTDGRMVARQEAKWNVKKCKIKTILWIPREPLIWSNTRLAGNLLMCSTLSVLINLK